MSSVSAISSALIKRTVPFCSSTTATLTTRTTAPYLALNKPICPPPQMLAHGQLPDPPDQYPTRISPEFSPRVLGYDQPNSIPFEVPGISTAPEIDPITTTPPEVTPYPPPLDPGPNPGPDFPVPPLNPPPVPDIPPPFPDNPLPNPDVLPPQPPDMVPPAPPGPEIIPPPAPPPPPTGPGGPIVV